MKVKVKDFTVNMEIKNTGIELQINDSKKHLGDLIVTGTNLIWCAGRTKRANGKKISWSDFINLAEGDAVKKAAKTPKRRKAAKHA